MSQLGEVRLKHQIVPLGAKLKCVSPVLRRRIGVFQNDKCRRLDPGPVRVGVQGDVLVIQWPDDLADVLSHLVLDLPVHGVSTTGVLGVVEEHVLVALAAGAAPAKWTE